MSHVTYSNLDRSKAEFRLIELAPGHFNSPIEAELSTASLDHPPTYEALSYVWGDNSLDYFITISSGRLNVTKNLHDALMHLRLHDRPRRIWVDAICINQNDRKEREEQVILMRRIYGFGEKVIIWLGKEESTDRLAFDFINSMADGAQTFTVASVNEPHDQAACQKTSLKEVEAIFKRPWWGRAWTLQELVLAKEAILYCGSLQISFDRLFEGLVQLTKQYSEFLEFMCEGCSRGFILWNYKCSPLLSQREAQNIGRGSDLLWIIANNQFRAATEPRDKIYAFLGVCYPEQASTIKPDYGAHIRDVYTDFAIQAMRWDKTLHVLKYTSNFDKNNLQIPSWVHDWTKYTYDADLLLGPGSSRYYIYNACGNQELVYFASNEVLRLEGIRVDLIAQVCSEEWNSDREGTSHVMKDWQQLVQFDANPHRKYANYPYTLKEAFWRTILRNAILDAHSNWFRPTPRYETAFWDAWYSELGSDSSFALRAGEEVTDVPSILDESDNHQKLGAGDIAMTVVLPNFDRKLFVTGSGLIGNGPKGTKIGDEIWVVGGGKCPLVLRKEARENLRPEQCLDETIQDEAPSELYTFVGDCYIHGIMDGEVAGARYEAEKQNVYIV